jgi:hypothetical protein
MKTLEGHKVEDLARSFNHVVEVEPETYPTPTEIRLHEARLADENRRLWMLSMKIALIVVGATIAVICVTLALALT